MKKFLQWLLLTVLGSAMACVLLMMWNWKMVYQFWFVIVAIVGVITWEKFFKDKS